MKDKKWLYMLCAAEIGTMMVMLNYSAVLPLVKEEWALTNAQAGLIFSAYQVGYILLVVILSTLTDYVDAKKIYIFSAFWAGAAGIAFAFFANGLTSALVLRCLTGFGLAGTYMPGLKMVSARYEPSTRGRAVGHYVGAFSIGTGLSLLVTGVLTALFNWRLAMFCTSLGPILGGILAVLILESNPPTKTERPDNVFRKVMTNRPAILLMTGYAAHMWEMFGMRGWVVAFLAAVLAGRNMDVTMATSYGAVFSSAIIAVGGISTAYAGSLSDRLGRVRTIQVIMLASAACSFVFGWLRPLPFWLVVIFSLVYGVWVTAESSVLSTAVTESVPFGYLGTAMALQSFLGWSAAALSPVAFGLVLDCANPLELVEQLGYTPNWGPSFVLLGLGALAGVWIVGRVSGEHKQSSCQDTRQ